ncbi:hypothetical protein SISNIDRAFT_484541 [Sistotremastrum niveocremeum HHB9708]|uniref:Uncharacterized protein n=1 Tax=Sistotremastrum niveocremeum HHB9708 TaxID=1314777 RepID=A0A164VN36_9AGAM|nr:hypothetical protein SISNIDRAFT_484541 [Sistotremastrum niveocremeum HHB9708]
MDPCSSEIVLGFTADLTSETHPRLKPDLHEPPTRQEIAYAIATITYAERPYEAADEEGTFLHLIEKNTVANYVHGLLALWAMIPSFFGGQLRVIHCSFYLHFYNSNGVTSHGLSDEAFLDTKWQCVTTLITAKAMIHVLENYSARRIIRETNGKNGSTRLQGQSASSTTLSVRPRSMAFVPPRCTFVLSPEAKVAPLNWMALTADRILSGSWDDRVIGGCLRIAEIASDGADA